MSRKRDPDATADENLQAAIGYSIFALWQVLVPDETEARWGDPPDEIQWPWHPSQWQPNDDPLLNVDIAILYLAAVRRQILEVRAAGGVGETP